MFLPPVFKEEDPDALFGLMTELSVATVVCVGAEGLIASHIPVEIDRRSGPHGTIRCHFAKPNPQQAAIAEGGEVLFIFQGPQAYVTPAWYPTKAETGKVVPTLNYAAVHAYGVGKVVDDPAKMRRHLSALTDHFETGFEDAWQVSDAPEDYITRLMKGITVVEVELTRLEGKWKMSQNRPEGDRVGVAEGLRAQQRTDVADLVEVCALRGRKG